LSFSVIAKKPATFQTETVRGIQTTLAALSRTNEVCMAIHLFCLACKSYFKYLHVPCMQDRIMYMQGFYYRRKCSLKLFYFTFSISMDCFVVSLLGITEGEVVIAGAAIQKIKIK
jgi:hypothetical protein